MVNKMISVFGTVITARKLTYDADFDVDFAPHNQKPYVVIKGICNNGNICPLARTGFNTYGNLRNPIWNEGFLAYIPSYIDVFAGLRFEIAHMAPVHEIQDANGNTKLSEQILGYHDADIYSSVNQRKIQIETDLAGVKKRNGKIKKALFLIDVTVCREETYSGSYSILNVRYPLFRRIEEIDCTIDDGYGFHTEWTRPCGPKYIEVIAHYSDNSTQLIHTSRTVNSIGDSGLWAENFKHRFEYTKESPDNSVVALCFQVYDASVSDADVLGSLTRRSVVEKNTKKTGLNAVKENFKNIVRKTVRNTRVTKANVFQKSHFLGRKTKLSPSEDDTPTSPLSNQSWQTESESHFSYETSQASPTSGRATTPDGRVRKIQITDDVPPRGKTTGIGNMIMKARKSLFSKEENPVKKIRKSRRSIHLKQKKKLESSRFESGKYLIGESFFHLDNVLLNENPGFEGEIENLVPPHLVGKKRVRSRQGKRMSRINTAFTFTDDEDLTDSYMSRLIEKSHIKLKKALRKLNFIYRYGKKRSVDAASRAKNFSRSATTNLDRKSLFKGAKSVVSLEVFDNMLRKYIEKKTTGAKAQVSGTIRAVATQYPIVPPLTENTQKFSSGLHVKLNTKGTICKVPYWELLDEKNDVKMRSRSITKKEAKKYVSLIHFNIIRAYDIDMPLDHLCVSVAICVHFRDSTSEDVFLTRDITQDRNPVWSERTCFLAEKDENDLYKDIVKVVFTIFNREAGQQEPIGISTVWLKDVDFFGGMEEEIRVSSIRKVKGTAAMQGKDDKKKSETTLTVGINLNWRCQPIYSEIHPPSPQQWIPRSRNCMSKEGKKGWSKYVDPALELTEDPTKHIGAAKVWYLRRHHSMFRRPKMDNGNKMKWWNPKKSRYQRKEGGPMEHDFPSGHLENESFRDRERRALEEALKENYETIGEPVYRMEASDYEKLLERPSLKELRPLTELAEKRMS